MEEFRMARQSKREYLQSIHERYRRARRSEKTAMLEEFCQVCGYNRKYAIWLLSRPLSRGTARRAVRQRSVTYGQATIAVLAKVWEVSGYLCSQRLQAALPQWRVLPSLDGSAAQIDPGARSHAEKIDAFELSRRIDQQIEILYDRARQRHGLSRENMPLRTSPQVRF